jgi:hypothetical protein
MVGAVVFKEAVGGAVASDGLTTHTVEVPEKMKPEMQTQASPVEHSLSSEAKQLPVLQDPGVFVGLAVVGDIVVGDNDLVGDSVGATVVGATVVGATVVGATVVGATVVGATVGATVVGATVVGATVVATVVGATVVGATELTVVGAAVVGAAVVGATVVGATVVGATVVGATVVGATVVGAMVALTMVWLAMVALGGLVGAAGRVFWPLMATIAMRSKEAIFMTMSPLGDTNAVSTQYEIAQGRWSRQKLIAALTHAMREVRSQPKHH